MMEQVAPSALGIALKLVSAELVRGGTLPNAFKEAGGLGGAVGAAMTGISARLDSGAPLAAAIEGDRSALGSCVTEAVAWSGGSAWAIAAIGDALLTLGDIRRKEEMLTASRQGVPATGRDAEALGVLILACGAIEGGVPLDAALRAAAADASPSQSAWVERLVGVPESGASEPVGISEELWGVVTRGTERLTIVADVEAAVALHSADLDRALEGIDPLAALPDSADRE